MKRRIIIPFLCCVCAAACATAQVRFASVRDVWAYADAHNIQLRAAEAGKASAGISVKQSYGAILPMVSANGSFTDNMTIQPTLIPANLFNPAAPAGTYTEATFGRRYIYNGNLAAQLDILNLQNWFNIKAAKLNYEISSLKIAQTRADLYCQLANIYYTCILLNEAENLSLKNVQTADKSCQVARNKFNEGQISQVTLNTALINKEKAEENLEVSIQNKAMQLNNLKAMLCVGDSIVLNEDIVDVNPDVFTDDFAPDPAVLLSSTQLQIARNKWQSSKAAFAPVLSGIYQYNIQIAGDNFLKFNNSNNLPQQYWGLRLSLPVFTGGARKYTVQNAKADYDLQQKVLANTQLQSEINNQNLLIAYSGALNSYNRSKSILALYESNDTHAELKLKEGIISLDDRLKVYADMITGQHDYLQSLSDYLIQQYRLQIRQTNFIK